MYKGIEDGKLGKLTNLDATTYSYRGYAVKQLYKGGSWLVGKLFSHGGYDFMEPYSEHTTRSNALRMIDTALTTRSSMLKYEKGTL